MPLSPLHATIFNGLNVGELFAERVETIPSLGLLLVKLFLIYEHIFDVLYVFSIICKKQLNNKPKTGIYILNRTVYLLSIDCANFFIFRPFSLAAALHNIGVDIRAVARSF